MKLGIRGKLLLVWLALLLGAVVVGELYLAPRLDRLVTERIRDDLLVRARLAEREATGLAASAADQAAWERLAQELAAAAAGRVTFIARDGRVLGDSEIPEFRLGEVESHLARPEVRDALARSSGASVRRSSTLGQRMMYAAVPFRGPDHEVVGVVRVAVPLTEVDRAVARMRRQLAIAALVMLAAAAVMSGAAAHWGSRTLRVLTRAARTMAGGDLSVRTGVAGNDEIAALGQALDQLAESLSESLTEQRRLEAVRREFVANASHELRTPVTALRTAAETLADVVRSAPGEAPPFVDIIERNSERLQHLVEDLLDLSRIEARELPLRLEAVELAPVVDQLLVLHRKLAETRGLVLRAELAPSLPPVRADRHALEQVLGNLVDNAAKYASPGATVTVRAAEDGPLTRIAVEDTGPGIEASHLPRLFERFYRVDRGRSRELGGTGLGLAIVKHLVEAMGGTVTVTSELGVGSCFAIALPSCPR